MADNDTLPATGSIIASDDIGGVKYQRVKLTWGPDGTANDADVATGKPIPLQLRTATGTAIGTAEDVASADGDGGIPILVRRAASPANTSGTDGDYETLQINGGALWVKNVPVGHSVAVSVTRTADTNVYAANDVIGAATGSTAALTCANMGASGSTIMITGAELLIEASSVISGETSYRLYLYNVTPPSASGDNAAWDLPSGDRASFLGFIELGTPVDLGSTLYVQNANINRQMILSGTSLFAYLVTVGTYTPTSARVYKVTLHSVEV